MEERVTDRKRAALLRAAAALRRIRKDVTAAIKDIDTASRQIGRTEETLARAMADPAGIYFVHHEHFAECLRDRHPEHAKRIRVLELDRLRYTHGRCFKLEWFDHVLQDFEPDRIPFDVVAPRD